jgi:hypothetical protein
MLTLEANRTEGRATSAPPPNLVVPANSSIPTLPVNSPTPLKKTGRKQFSYAVGCLFWFFVISALIGEKNCSSNEPISVVRTQSSPTSNPRSFTEADKTASFPSPSPEVRRALPINPSPIPQQIGESSSSVPNYTYIFRFFTPERGPSET